MEENKKIFSRKLLDAAFYILMFALALNVILFIATDKFQTMENFAWIVIADVTIVCTANILLVYWILFQIFCDIAFILRKKHK